MKRNEKKAQKNESNLNCTKSYMLTEMNERRADAYYQGCIYVVLC